MAVAIGIFGALIGSFLNVVIYRVPVKKSIISPPSACGSCGHVVRWQDNIPVVSWLALRGTCRDCGSRISARYPLVELGGAVLFAVVAIRFVPAIVDAGANQAAIGQILALIAFLYLAAISIALALIDLDTATLPNSIVLPAYAVGFVFLGGASLATGNVAALATAGIAAVALFVVYLTLALVFAGGMGFGDVKLAGVLGLFLGWLGWDTLVVGALAAFILGGLFGVVLLVIRRASRKTRVPFGPWMLAGAWVGIIGGHELAAGYLSLFGLGGS